MQLGIFTKTFVRPSLEENLDAVRAHGLRAVQYNLESAGGPSMPAHIEPALCARIRAGLAQRDIALAALSGTFNIIHPDTQERDRGFQRLRQLAVHGRTGMPLHRILLLGSQAGAGQGEGQDREQADAGHGIDTVRGRNGDYLYLSGSGRRDKQRSGGGGPRAIGLKNR